MWQDKGLSLFCCYGPHMQMELTELAIQRTRVFLIPIPFMVSHVFDGTSIDQIRSASQEVRPPARYKEQPSPYRTLPLCLSLSGECACAVHTRLISLFHHLCLFCTLCQNKLTNQHYVQTLKLTLIMQHGISRLDQQTVS